MCVSWLKTLQYKLSITFRYKKLNSSPLANELFENNYMRLSLWERLIGVKYFNEARCFKKYNKAWSNLVSSLVYGTPASLEIWYKYEFKPPVLADVNNVFTHLIHFQIHSNIILIIVARFTIWSSHLRRHAIALIFFNI